MKLLSALIVSSLFCSSLFLQASYRPRGQDPRYRTIFVQTANNKKTACSADETIATFFQQCRHQGDCMGQQLSLIFGPYEIKEGTEAANKRFNQYNTLSKEAFVQEHHDNRLASNNNIATTQNNAHDTNRRMQDFFAGVVSAIVATFFYLTH